MDRALDLYCKVLGFLIAFALMVMVALVFGNVVLRYLFNAGITVSEELSRWLFVWVTFLGGIIALREHAHLGTDVLLGRLSPGGKKVCLLVGQVLMLYVCWLLFKGSLEQTAINMGVAAPASQLPVGIVYAAGVVFAVSAVPILLWDLWRTITGRVPDDQLVMTQGSEEAGALAHGALDVPNQPR